MNLPEITIEELLESGVHFGHNVRRWNPKMEEYIFGVRNNIHIFDLRITAEALNTVAEKICDFINPKYDDRIKLIKDISAGAVSFAVMSSLIVLIIIYYPYVSACLK